MKASMLRSAATTLRRASSSSSPSSTHLLCRSFSSDSNPDHQVAVLGAAGGIGQPVALLMKLNPLISSLFLYDIAGTPGIAADVSHINTRAQALVNMISNPVNSTVPIAAEVFKKAGTYDEKKLFGVTMLDVVRAKTFYAGKAKVPVATPKAYVSDEDIKALTNRTQDGGTEVVEAKARKGCATLSMAYAGAIFADACLKGLNGVPNVVECSFVQSTITELPFFASKVRLGKNGVEEVLGLGPLSDYEKQVEYLGLPLVPPYFSGQNGSCMNFQEGVNFAVMGATALDIDFFKQRGIHNPFASCSLGNQLDWFKKMLPSLCHTRSSEFSIYVHAAEFAFAEVAFVEVALVEVALMP
ncbi:hypothetical protein LOK49_LG09G02325 [Camellia lanceoleosa]|uniref:Uncharacterized protein n=1 Tax=Camellia lanceoleosa TaxID=1840588 RepID=A0ACC0GFT2_9ERIC|nr:hypothetical protein LOK49_LG09G02325 [Camellia lanceoleosa]